MTLKSQFLALKVIQNSRKNDNSSYEQLSENLRNLGFLTVPTNGKIPIINGWARTAFQNKKQCSTKNEKHLAISQKKGGNFNVALVLNKIKSSNGNVVGWIDIDDEVEESLDFLEKTFPQLSQNPLIRVTGKGVHILAQFDPKQKRKTKALSPTGYFTRTGEHCIDILTSGLITHAGTHKNGLPYITNRPITLDELEKAPFIDSTSILVSQHQSEGTPFDFKKIKKTSGPVAHHDCDIDSEEGKNLLSIPSGERTSCPFHGGSNTSVLVAFGNGKFYCHAGCGTILHRSRFAKDKIIVSKKAVVPTTIPERTDAENKTGFLYAAFEEMADILRVFPDQHIETGEESAPTDATRISGIDFATLMSFGTIERDDDVAFCDLEEDDLVDGKYLPTLDLPLNGRCLIAIRSPKGTGKTFGVAEAIEDLNERFHDEFMFGSETVVGIAHTQTLTQQMAKTLGVDCYLDKKQGRRLLMIDGSCTITPNSLYRYIGPDPGVLVLDEITSILQSITHKGTHGKAAPENLHKLKRIVKRSRIVILLDADMTSRAIEQIQNWREGLPDATLIIHAKKQDQYTRVVTEPAHVTMELIHRIKEENEAKNKRKTHYIFSDSKSELNAIEKQLIKRGLLKKGEICLITSDTISKLDVANINDWIGKYRVVLASPTIVTGVSINIPFDYAYGVSKGGSISMAQFDQGVRRVRTVKNPRILVGLEKHRGSLDFRSEVEIYNSYVRRDLIGRKNSFNRGYKAVLDAVQDEYGKFIEIDKKQNNYARHYAINQRESNMGGSEKPLSRYIAFCKNEEIPISTPEFIAGILVGTEHETKVTKATKASTRLTKKEERATEAEAIIAAEILDDGELRIIEKQSQALSPEQRHQVKKTKTVQMFGSISANTVIQKSANKPRFMGTALNFKKLLIQQFLPQNIFDEYLRAEAQQRGKGFSVVMLKNNTVQIDLFNKLCSELFNSENQTITKAGNVRFSISQDQVTRWMKANPAVADVFQTKFPRHLLNKNKFNDFQRSAIVTGFVSICNKYGLTASKRESTDDNNHQVFVTMDEMALFGGVDKKITQSPANRRRSNHRSMANLARDPNNSLLGINLEKIIHLQNSAGQDQGLGTKFGVDGDGRFATHVSRIKNPVFTKLIENKHSDLGQQFKETFESFLKNVFSDILTTKMSFAKRAIATATKEEIQFHAGLALEKLNETTAKTIIDKSLFGSGHFLHSEWLSSIGCKISVKNLLSYMAKHGAPVLETKEQKDEFKAFSTIAPQVYVYI